MDAIALWLYEVLVEPFIDLKKWWGGEPLPAWAWIAHHLKENYLPSVREAMAQPTPFLGGVGDAEALARAGAENPPADDR